MKNLRVKTIYTLQIALACVIYIMLIPATVVQALYFIIQWVLFGKCLFDTVTPISGQAALKILNKH